MTSLGFAEPQWAPLFWGLAALVVLLVWLERRGGAGLARFVSGELQGQLVAGPGRGQRMLRIALLGLCLAFAITALMRPQWGLRLVATPRAGAEIMICLDVSRSMLAEDVAPNRLERAKADIADLLGYLDGDQVGLIAFAGRASVLSPLTPDFSFLRLVLDHASSTSVTRGGTRLEEPLRKALRGFGPPGESSRAILLITDGEDHDSLPLDAAAQAAEAGVKIIAIGIGDEGGSQIHITDPKTRARTLLRDADGRPVRSRLDGDLLRRLALETGGAYVPAGTGLLDLEGIYDTHLAGLLRGELDGHTRRVREDAYQIALFLALLSLLASVLIAGGRPGSGKMLRGGLVLAACLAAAPPTAAQDANLPTPDGEAGEVLQTAAPQDPRDVYNGALAALRRGDLEEAAHTLRLARRDARDDGELRFRAAYNLGIAAWGRADGLEAEDPAAALAALGEAADWFRRAIRLRPEDADGRHNLEVTLRRALLLADRMAREAVGGLDQRLAELAAAQRQRVSAIAGLQQQLASNPESSSTEPVRHAFKDLSTLQRTVLTDADRVARDAAAESDALQARAPEDRGPEEEVRSAQLGNLLHYLHRARERMGQARRQLRQRQGSRAHRRTSAALVELKRALDQLRDPRALLEAIARDQTQLALEGTALGAAGGALGDDDTEMRPPAWITLAYLGDSQRAIAERVQELEARLREGIAAGPPPEADPSTTRLFRAAGEALPLVQAAQLSLASAADAFEAEDLPAGATSQHRGLQALLQAREVFLDLRGLIEAVHGDQTRIEALLEAEAQEREIPIEDYLPALRQAQIQNLERVGRLEGMIDEIGSAAPEAEAEERDAALKRQQIARTLLDLTRGSMQDARAALGEPGSDAALLRRAEAGAASREAVERVEALRRLFFSIVEHVRDTAREQLELADRTQATLEPGAEEPAPLVPRQEALARRTEALADALEEQSRREGDGLDGETDAEETTRRLRSAGEHVLAAGDRMTSAAGALAADPVDVEAARGAQDEALASLREALALLVPPEQRSPPQPRTESGESSEQKSAGGDEKGEEEQRQRAQADPSRLLQEVRDREAQRRRDRAARHPSGYEAVEKDW